MQKRKAAANVFREQNEMEEEIFDSDEFGLANQAAVEKPAPPPSPVAAGPMLHVQSYAGAPASAPNRRIESKKKIIDDGLKTSEELQLEKEPLRVRETGWGRWKRVIVPPNAYVVHTRLGKPQPVTLGLGVSFRYNPLTDAYLIVPAAMQTIGVVANCISQEKQGINVLAYVQWQIKDFAVAYRKLDFSDSHDPLAIVNAQLREQAEAAIKDKIATMSVEEVLTDKQPVIEELTSRLKNVAEGQEHLSDGESEGLGIRIVTVQIKEAIVSSQKLWHDLQAPFRNQQSRIAQISQLETSELIRQKQLETREQAETSEAETLVAIERVKQNKQTEAQEVRVRQETLRFTRDQEAHRSRLELEEETTRLKRESEQRLATQQAQIAQVLRLDELQREQAEQLAAVEVQAETRARQKALETEEAIKVMAEEQRLAVLNVQAQLESLQRKQDYATAEYQFEQVRQAQQRDLELQTFERRLERERQETLLKLELQTARNNVEISLAQRQAELARIQQEIRNLTNQSALTQSMIDILPSLAAEMPEINELRVMQTGGDQPFDLLAGFLTKISGLADHLGLGMPYIRSEEE